MTNEYQPPSGASEGNPDVDPEVLESLAAEPESVAHDPDDKLMPLRQYPEIASTPEAALRAYMEQLDIEYTERLAELLTSCLGELYADEQAVIKSDEELRNKTAYALRELGIDESAFDFGRYVVTPYVAHDPEISWLAQELNARAQQVDEAFEAKAAEIAHATGALHLPGEVKDINRISEKIEVDYMSRLGGEDFTVDAFTPLVKDAARCRLVIEGIRLSTTNQSLTKSPPAVFTLPKTV